MTKEKILDKLQKIKKHQESAKEIGNEAEAQAFAEMLQKLLFTHRLEMTDLEFEKMEEEEPIMHHSIQYPPELKVKRQRVPWREKLTSIVARAHFCRILVSQGTSRITLIGRKSDIEIAEYMIITLMKAARSLSKAAEREYKKEKSRSVMLHQERGDFRDSWLEGFIWRLQQRLTELRAAHESSSSTALVRVNKSEAAVVNYMNRFGKAKPLPQLSELNGLGWTRGVDTANRMNLKANAMTGSSTEVKKIGS